MSSTRFLLRRLISELAQGLPSGVLAWHTAGSSMSSGVVLALNPQVLRLWPYLLTRLNVYVHLSCLASTRKSEASSQHSLHIAPIFRLLLKVAVNGMHQCDFVNFCGALGLQRKLKHA